MDTAAKQVFVFLALACWAGVVNATPIVLWNQSPAAIGGTLTNSGYTNEANRQNFSDLVRFETGVLLTGMDIYMDFRYGDVGDEVAVRLRTGSPSGTLFEFGETVSINDTEDTTVTVPAVRRVHVDFTNSVSLAANTDYWIGMSGTTQTFLQAAYINGTGPLLDNRMAQYEGTDFQYFTSSAGDQAFRLWGEVQASAPEAHSLALVGIGLASLGWFRRKKVLLKTLFY